jgi:phage shock protein A
MLTGEARASAARLTDPSASVDAAYRAQLELVADVRAQLVELITARKRLEMQIGTWERSGVRYAEVQALHDEIAALKAREEVVNGAVDEMRRRADALRAEREITRARVAAARAGITASSSIAGLTPQHDEIRAWLEQARSQTLDLEARAAALNELVARESGRTAISE